MNKIARWKTISRAEDDGAMVVDALALFPVSPMKTVLEQVVASAWQGHIRRR